MEIDNFISNTIKTHPLLFNNGHVITDKTNEKYLKHLLEFKAFLMANYLVKKLYDEPGKVDILFNHCANTLEDDYLISQYGEPQNIKSSAFIDKNYFKLKLRYYMTEIFEYLRNEFFNPEYCYQSLINSPLSNELDVSDDDFYSRFYNNRIKHLIILLDYTYHNPEEFNRIYFDFMMDLEITDDLDETLFEEREKQLNEKLLEKVIIGLSYEINKDYRNYILNLDL